jgi:hypothetical protein
MTREERLKHLELWTYWQRKESAVKIDGDFLEDVEFLLSEVRKLEAENAELKRSLSKAISNEAKNATP